MTSTETVNSETLSSQATEESSALPGCDLTIDSQSAACPLSSTPKRSRRQTAQIQGAYQTSTPVRSSAIDNPSNTSTSPAGAKQVELECTKFTKQLKVFDHIFPDHVFYFWILSPRIFLQLISVLFLSSSYICSVADIRGRFAMQSIRLSEQI